MRPAEGILSAEDTGKGIDAVRSCGGEVSMRALPGGGQSPYELNITWFEAMKGTFAGEDGGAHPMARDGIAAREAVRGGECHLAARPGGLGALGVGDARHGAGGIRKYCHQQTILVDRFGLSKEPIWYPVPKGAVNLYKRILNLLFRSGWRNKLSA